MTDEDLYSIAGDGDRGVTLVDFLNIMAKREQETSLREKLKKSFSVFDNDGSGFISMGPESEFRKAMMSWGDNPYTAADWDAFVSEYLEMVAEKKEHALEDELCDYGEFINL